VTKTPTDNPFTEQQLRRALVVVAEEHRDAGLHQESLEWTLQMLVAAWLRAERGINTVDDADQYIAENRADIDPFVEAALREVRNER